jgi:3-deoxy-D-manno-octulosonic-acid transferase
MTIIFDLIFLVYFILYFPFLLLSGKWHAGLVFRLGWIPGEMRARIMSRRNIWLHAVSVGEVAAVEGLVKALRLKHAEAGIVFTVTTRTGYELARKKFGPEVTVIFSPLDLGLTVERYISMIRPVVYVAAETELWPNLFLRLSHKKVPVIIVNGRISEKAFARYRLVKPLLKVFLSVPQLYLMQSRQDAGKIIDLGAPETSVRVVGNIKLDQAPEVRAVKKKDLGFNESDVVFTGGSTHSGEEDVLTGVYADLRQRYPDLRLVLAPRHPERSRAVGEAVKKRGLKPLFLSGGCRGVAADEVLIVDTVGELLSFYSISAFVFVGKSLTARGGHNIIEPALFGKAVMTGPHMSNFKDIAELFLAQEALIQVNDARSLKEAALRLLDDPQAREAIGKRARQVVESNRGALARTLELIDPCLIKGRVSGKL